MSRIYILIMAVLAGAVLFSCREEITPPAPGIALDNESGIYTVKAGRMITISPSYSNAEGAEYSWTLEGGEKLSDAPVLEFMREETGRYYIVLTVSNAGGSAQAQIRIDVQDITPPTISLPGAGDGFVILQGTFLELRPTVASSLETTYSWSVDGSEVSTEPVYTFVGDETGEYLLRLETVNEDGSDAVQFTVSVKSPDEVDFPGLSFRLSTISHSAAGHSSAYWMCVMPLMLSIPGMWTARRCRQEERRTMFSQAVRKGSMRSGW